MVVQEAQVLGGRGSESEGEKERCRKGGEGDRVVGKMERSGTSAANERGIFTNSTLREGKR